jgi:hypothetical protein
MYDPGSFLGFADCKISAFMVASYWISLNLKKAVRPLMLVPNRAMFRIESNFDSQGNLLIATMR